jgi:hypothetical protein
MLLLLLLLAKLWSPYQASCVCPCPHPTNTAPTSWPLCLSSKTKPYAVAPAAFFLRMVAAHSCRGGAPGSGRGGGGMSRDSGRGREWSKKLLLLLLLLVPLVLVLD